MMGASPTPPNAKTTFTRKRVSSSGQRDDLGRQVAAQREQFPNHVVVRDVASGLNFKRPGFLRLMDAVCAGGVAEVVVAHKDRLCRFAFDLVKWQIERFGGRVVVLDSSDRTPQEELCEDLCAVVTVFGARLHGMWRYETTKRRRTDDESATQQAAEVGVDGDGADVPEGARSKKRSRRADAAAGAADSPVPTAGTAEDAERVDAHGEGDVQRRPR